MKKRFTGKEFTDDLIDYNLFLEWKKNTQFKDKSFEDFLIIWDAIAETYINTVVENTDGARLGMYIGDLSCQYVPVEYILEKGKKVRPLNLMSYGKVGKIVLETGKTRKFNVYSSLYAFKPSTYFQRRGHHQFKNAAYLFKNCTIKRTGLYAKIKKLQNKDANRS